MSLRAQFIRNVLFPIHEKLKRHTTIQVHRQMEITQWMSAEELGRLQIKRLRDFMVDIGEHVPYYRELFLKSGFKPSSIESVSDLQRLPILEKSDIRANTDFIKSDKAEPLQKFSTSGSSGEPLVFYLGDKRVSHDVAAKRRATRWWGVDIGDPEMVFWASPIELNSQDRVRLARDWLFRTELFSAFDGSEKNLEILTQAITRKKPAMLFGYPSLIALLAEHAIKHDIAMANPGIKVIFVTAETLYDHQRKSIERAFGCPVANGYGGRDAGFIAHQCPEGAMHITSEDIIVEIVDSADDVLPNGQSGEIIVTNLSTGDFPFVRYRTGDIGVLSNSECKCGRGLPILEEVQGRTNDFLLDQGGSKVHQTAIAPVFRELSGLLSFKIIQDSLNSIRVQLVVGSGFDQNEEGRISKSFRELLGERVQVIFDYLSEIPREKSGKLRYVVCNVPH